MQKFKTLMGIINDKTPEGFWSVMFLVSLFIGFEYPLVGNIMMWFIIIALGMQYLLAVCVWIENVVIEYKRQTGVW